MSNSKQKHEIPIFLNTDFYIAHGEILISSYQSLVRSELFGGQDRTTTEIMALWNAPFAVVSHGIENDPIFNFGNRTALALFELDFDDFIKLPSRKSAEEINQRERKRLLEEVSNNGFIKNYSGVRISAAGKRFSIEDALVWNLTDGSGSYYGQAALFKRWVYL